MADMVITPGCWLVWYGEFLNMLIGSPFTLDFVLDCALSDLVAQFKQMQSFLLAESFN